METQEDDGTLNSIVSDHIKKVLLKTNGKIHGSGGAAEILGENPSTLRNRMKRLGIDYKQYFSRIKYLCQQKISNM